MLLFRTPIGSRLYGLAHANSDNDTLEVYSNTIPSPLKKIRQTIDGKDDVIRTNLSTFVMYAERSSHQILEAMYSPIADVDMFKDFRMNYHINIGTFVPLYQRTIRNFWTKGDRKSKLHACRMHFCLLEGMDKGYFSPVLEEKQRAFLLNSETEEFDKLVEPYFDGYVFIDGKWVSEHSPLLFKSQG